MPEFTGRLRTPRLASAPSSPVAGELYFNTSTGVLYFWTGSAWQSAAGTTGSQGPPGPANERVIQVKAFADSTAVATGDGKAIVCISDDLNGLSLTDADAYVTTNGSSSSSIALRRIRAGAAVDMLATAITIDASEPTSYTAATPPAIDTANDDVLTADLIAVDVDAAGAGAKGLGVVLTFG